MKQKIVYVIGGLYGPSGMGQVLSMKTNYLAENTDYQIYIILTEKKGTPLYYTMSPKIQFVNFDINFDELDTMPTHQKIVHYYKKQRRYKKMFSDYLMEIKPDITVSAVRRDINFINSIPDGSIKVGEIHFNKGDYRNFNKRFLPGFINRTISKKWMGQLIGELKKLSRFVVLSYEDKESWTEIENVQVIYNPLSFLPQKVSDLSEKKVIAVGRYTWQKGFDRLIDAWSIVSRKHPDWKLHIYGGGDKAPYQELAKQKGVDNTLVCESAVKNIVDKYLESTLFVLSSRYEGFGMVITEAMACGLPVVSFDCPCGPKDIIQTGVNGLLAPNGNIEMLADKICYLIEHEKERKEMGEKARENVARFDINNIMKQWLELFETVLAEKEKSL